MPNFGQKAKKSGGATKTVNKAPAAETREPKPRVTENTMEEDTSGNAELAMGPVEPEEIKPSPFVDGLVSSRLNGLVVIPRIGGEEVELFRGFLRHFSTAAPFAGNIVSKTSFMRRKGGRLL